MEGLLLNRCLISQEFLLLYGSLRERSYSRLVVEESALLQVLGAESKIFDPRGLPQPDTEDESHAEGKRIAGSHDLVGGPGVVLP